MARVRLKGLQRLERRFKRLGRVTEDAVERQLDASADEILARAIALVPERTRRLLISGAIARAKLARAIGFDTDYAVIVHEDIYTPGPITAAKAGTEDGMAGRKYLERPFNNIRGRLLKDDFPKALLRAFRAFRR